MVYFSVSMEKNLAPNAGKTWLDFHTFLQIVVQPP